MNELGELVRAYRKYEGLTQEDLADNVGRSITTISRIENDIPVGSISRELVLRELGIPVFCMSYSVEYSKLIEIKREMLAALYADDKDWYMSVYEEYLECHELDGLMGEMYTEYFGLMYAFLNDGCSKSLNKGLLEIFNKVAPVKSYVNDIENKGIDLHDYKYFVRRQVRENESEIDLLLINGIGISLFLQREFKRAKTLFVELISQSKLREDIFEEKHSNVPTLTYNLALCYLAEGRYAKAGKILEEAEKEYTFRDNLRLELKYKEFKMILHSSNSENNHKNLSPIFSFPKPVYWYTITPDIKNLKKFA